MHITAHAVAGLPSFRQPSIARIVLAQLNRLNDGRFQIVHFSVQSNHVHLIVEADGESLERKMRGFMVSVAKRLNLLLARRGRVWRDRFYSRAIAR